MYITEFIISWQVINRRAGNARDRQEIGLTISITRKTRQYQACFGVLLNYVRFSGYSRQNSHGYRLSDNESCGEGMKTEIVVHRLAQLMLWAVCLGFVACAPVSRPNLGVLYSDLARHEDPYRNPIIVIPGLLGSRLVDGELGTVVWGAFGLGQVDPGSSEGARLVALPMQPEGVLRDLRDSVVPDGALDRYVVNFLGYPVTLNAYYNILSALGVGGYRDQGLGQAGVIDYGDQHFTCFQFDYDWRRDIVENAQALDRFIQERAHYVRSEIKRRFGIDRTTIRFDIVAHSMGGLLARYYLRYGAAELPAGGPMPSPDWAGAQFVDNLIMIGTPNAGSLDSLVHLVDGYRPSFLLSSYPAAVLGTFPSLYQMLPRARHAPLVDAGGRPVPDLLDPELWQRCQWGLADPGQARILEMLLPEVADAAERRRIALDYQARVLGRARRFMQAMDVPARPPDSLRILLVAGDAVPTAQTMGINPEGRLEWIAEGPGDGVVLRRSALMDERWGATARDRLISPISWHQTLFLFSDHIGLTRDPAFTDNVLHFLLEYPRSSRTAPVP